MKCPIDGEILVVADRSGVEIDYCPKCRGVWLDRGELDKIIDRSATVVPLPESFPQAHPEEFRSGNAYDDDDDDFRKRKGRRRGRDSFLSDIFDF